MAARPPWLLRQLFALLLPFRDREFILGDLEEGYARVHAAHGGWRARLWYLRQAFNSTLREAHYGVTGDVMLVPGEPRRGNVLDTIRQDLSHAIRSLNRRPVFTTVAVLTLALGIGANTAVFSVANWLLLRPVPGISRPDELAVIRFTESPGNDVGVSWQLFSDLQGTLARSFTGAAGLLNEGLQVAAPNAPPLEIQAEVVAGDYFRVLGVRPQLGRPVHSAETAAGRPVSVAVISDQLWTSLFQRDPDVLGRTVHANRLSFTVVGVAPPDFRGVDRRGNIDMWVPYSMYGAIRHFKPELYLKEDFWAIDELIVRFREGAVAATAEAEVRAAMPSLVRDGPTSYGIYTAYPAHVHPGIGIDVLIRDRTRQTVGLMLGVVVVLLVISAANVANMLLVRAVQRVPEVATRRVLGASAKRIAAQHLAESFVLVLLGGAVGMLVTRVFLELIEGSQLARLQPIADVPIDGRVLAFSAGVISATGLLFTLVPLVVLRSGQLGALMAGSARTTRRGSGVRAGIVVAQTALSLCLLVGALLLGRTLTNLVRVDIGFNPDRVFGFFLNLEPQNYTEEERATFRQDLHDRLRALPEVENAAITVDVPFWCCQHFGNINRPGAADGAKVMVTHQYVSQDYFETLQVPLVRGRGPLDADQLATKDGPANVVLNESAAKELFGLRNPLGATLVTGDRQPRELHVVGVVKDVRFYSLLEPPPAIVYGPMSGYGPSQMAVLVRPRSDIVAARAAVRRAVAALDPMLPLGYEGTLAGNVRRSIGEQRMFALLLLLFSGLAVALAAVGLYGVLAFSVSERTREIGIRVALGARRASILRLVAAQSTRMVGTGIALGLLAALWLTRLVESKLFGVERLDPLTYIVAVLLFAGIAALATAVPTRAAVRVNPTIALRHE